VPPQRRSGGSKALPIVVAAGLAVGVFGGLIIMNGVGSRSAEASSTSGDTTTGTAVDTSDAGAKGDDTKDEPAAAAQSVDAGADAGTAVASAADAATEPATVDAGSADTVAVAAQSNNGRSTERGDRRTTDRQRDRRNNGTKSGGGDLDQALTPSGFGDSSSPPVGGAATLTFKISPPSIPGLKITVDGSSVSGMSAKIKLDGRSKKVKVVATARGYRTWSRRYTVRRSLVIRVRMRRPERNSSPGGLIDL